MKEFGAKSNGGQKRNGGGHLNEKVFRNLGSELNIILCWAIK